MNPRPPAPSSSPTPLSTTVAIDRQLVATFAVVCWLMAGWLWWTGWEGTADLWQGAFSRVGVVMAALWLAVPAQGSGRPLARVSWPTLGLIVLGLLILVRIRIPLKILLPALIITAIVVRIVRPRSKTRPQSRVV